MTSNYMELKFPSLSENEALARVSVAALVAQVDPTLEELNEIKTVVSEAVTNAIIHGYEEKRDGIIVVRVQLDERQLIIEVEDFGVGIPNLEEARQPLYTTKPELERSGMGFTIIENFMDHVEITTEVGKGTKIKMVKNLSNQTILS
ncbi:anti-sigma factor (antagonist of sigma(F)) and serine kinase [[Clostridium] ultunense Esp]|nr:anti-sigma factor (antagonist of sigma(F)) and serine kinase [[Clostridium] ultunense Esp]